MTRFYETVDILGVQEKASQDALRTIDLQLRELSAQVKSNVDDITTLNDSVAAAGAPADAEYMVISANSTLTNERRITVSSPLQGTDGGAGGTYTIASNGTIATAAADITDNALVRGDGGGRGIQGS